MTANTQKASPTAAERMRQYRKRRRRGTRCIRLALDRMTIDAFVREKLLKEEERDDPLELQWAVVQLISRIVDNEA
jgi:hypothetical protein